MCSMVFIVGMSPLLPEDGPITLALLMSCIECLSVLPRQVALLIIAMIPKGAGKDGHRPNKKCSVVCIECGADVVKRWLLSGMCGMIENNLHVARVGQVKIVYGAR